MSSLSEETNVYKKQLEDWVKALGLPNYTPDSGVIEEILGFTRESLQQRTSTQLSEDTVILAQYALFLQQKINECQTFIKWSNQVVNRMFGDDRPRLNAWVRKAELRIERSQYLARRIEFIGNSMSGLVRSRYNEGINR